MGEDRWSKPHPANVQNEAKGRYAVVQTKPIAHGLGKRQVLCGEGVMVNCTDNGLRRNKANSGSGPVGWGLGDTGRGVLYKQTQFAGPTGRDTAWGTRGMACCTNKPNSPQTSREDHPQGPALRLPPGREASVQNKANLCPAGRQSRSGTGCTNKTPTTKVPESDSDPRFWADIEDWFRRS
jgi:hypothetical protein